MKFAPTRKFALSVILVLACLTGPAPALDPDVRTKVSLCTDVPKLTEDLIKTLLPLDSLRKLHPSRGEVAPAFGKDGLTVGVNHYFVLFSSGYAVEKMKTCLDTFPHFNGQSAWIIVENMSENRIPIGGEFLPAFNGPPGGYSMTRYFIDGDTEVFLTLHGEQEKKIEFFIHSFSCHNGRVGVCR